MEHRKVESQSSEFVFLKQLIPIMFFCWAVANGWPALSQEPDFCPISARAPSVAFLRHLPTKVPDPASDFTNMLYFALIPGHSRPNIGGSHHEACILSLYGGWFGSRRRSECLGSQPA